MSLIQFFDKNRILLLDGATGSQLISRGLKAGECPELWNLNHAEDIQAVASLYFQAGSDAVLTNTFGGSAIKLKGYALGQKVYDLNFAGAKNVIEVRPAGKFVIGSIGPSGKMLEPFGDVSFEEMSESFSIQAKALIDAGVDGIMLETFLDINEAECAFKAIQEIADIPIIVSLSFTKGPMGYFTMMGNSIEEVVDHFSELGAFAIGSNCGNGIDKMIEVAQLLRNKSSQVRIMVKPNAGEPEIKNGVTNYSQDIAYFLNKAKNLLSSNPSMLGGCCGTTPDHIRGLRKIIDSI